MIFAIPAVLVSTSILFVGNSYTASGGGVWNQVKAMYDSVSPDTLTVCAHVAGGATLEDHWNNTDLRDVLETGDFDVAVFQEQSCMPVTNPALTYEYGDSLACLCVSLGIQPVFFMTWARKNDPLMMEGLCLGYSRMGLVNSCPVAPCGLSFEILRYGNPGIDPWDADGAHPSLHGSYLASCVIAVTTSGIDLSAPGIWHPGDISDEQSEVLRETAASACSSYVQPCDGIGR